MQQAGNQEFNVTFSCGIADWRGDTAQALCERADRALYTSNSEGRNRMTQAGS